MKKIRAWDVALLFIFLAPLAAKADPIVAGGILVGATGVDVNGTLYDVAFVDGTCEALFSGCDELTDFDFRQQEALVASQALLDQVFLDGEFLLDTNPALTAGCSSGVEFCSPVITPFDLTQLNPNGFRYAYAQNHMDESRDLVDIGQILRTLDTDSDECISCTFALWTIAAPTKVPEPEGWVLLAFGLAGLGWARRHEQRPQKASV